MNLGKLAALGAVGVSLALVAIYAFLCWVSLSRNVTGGIDPQQQHVAWIAMLVPALLIIAAHLAVARHLWAWGNGKRFSY
jgi:divalent metal cation (Fe/Co/Zn/Cd) transporter